MHRITGAMVRSASHPTTRTARPTPIERPKADRDTQGSNNVSSPTTSPATHLHNALECRCSPRDPLARDVSYALLSCACSLLARSCARAAGSVGRACSLLGRACSLLGSACSLLGCACALLGQLCVRAAGSVVHARCWLDCAWGGSVARTHARTHMYR